MPDLNWAYLYVWDGSAWVELKGSSEGVIHIVHAGETWLHWITINASAANALVELSDDLDGSGAVVWEYFVGVRKGEQVPFPVPFHFTTGLYIKTFTNLTSLVFGHYPE
jgi:hypothetical protein